MRTPFIYCLLAAGLLLAACGGAPKTEPKQAAEEPLAAVIERGLDRATEQSLRMARQLEHEAGRLPKSIVDGKLETSDYSWWCSGFFPGELWYLYEYKQTPELKRYAELYTDRLEAVKHITYSHDVGFMLYCSYGNGYRLTGNPAYKTVMLEGARSLATRYNPKIGLIRSWDFNKEKWQYPVIIDNMMNLEFLMWASRASGDDRYRQIAISHADKTLLNHFRPDHSSYHVVSYDTISGQPHCKVTHQGAADSSAWARGQAWALYGYTMMYRETGNDAYLEQARGIARFLMDHPRMPADKVPYWDFDAPGIPEVPRDASAAAIMASALVELGQTDGGDFGKRCLAFAEAQLRTLSSPAYLAATGSNCDFVLMHSTGNFPGGGEVDVPLTYADYYYVEALLRLKKALKL